MWISYIIIVAILAACVLFADAAQAFQVVIKNDTAEDYYYELTWNECDWPRFPKDFTMAAGVIHPGEKHTIGAPDRAYDYQAGRWTMTWSKPHRSVYPMNVPQDGTLYLEANKIPYFIRKK